MYLKINEKLLKSSTPPFKMVIFYLFLPCPATFRIQFSENSWNQLNNREKKSMVLLLSGSVSLLVNVYINVYCFCKLTCNTKRLLHDIFHIGPGISPRLPYQARQRSWSADMGRRLIPGTIWKISCHNLFITYFTLTFSKHWRGPGWLGELGSWIT